MCVVVCVYMQDILHLPHTVVILFLPLSSSPPPSFPPPPLPLFFFLLFLLLLHSHFLCCPYLISCGRRAWIGQGRDWHGKPRPQETRTNPLPGTFLSPSPSLPPLFSISSSLSSCVSPFPFSLHLISNSLLSSFPQFPDSQTYVKVLTKLQILHPIEVSNKCAVMHLTIP